MITAILLASALLTAGEPVTYSALEVVDGDTLRVDGERVRIANVDTPETQAGQFECLAEKLLGDLATERAKTLIASGAVVIWPEGRADAYRRPLVRVMVDGVDWLDAMGPKHAVKWEGKQADWCGPVNDTT